jgi:hypothetical protein
MPDIYVANRNQVKKNKPKKISKKILKKNITGLDHLLKRTTNPLASFMAKPAKVRFETQERKEKIILLLRRHWATNLPWAFKAILLLFASLGLSLLPFWEALPPQYRAIISPLWYLLTFSYAFEKFLSWFFNVNIITDERIIDIDFPSILYKDISETKIDQVQDISIKIGGFIRSLFNFGDINIQTAGTQPEIKFEAVPNPEQVLKVLNQLVLEEEREKLEGRVR